MRSQVQVLAGPPPPGPAETPVGLSGSCWARRVPDQELLPDYRSSSWLLLQVSAEARLAPPGVENGRERTINDLVVRPPAQPFAGQLTRPSGAPRWRCGGCCAFGSPAAPSPCPAGPTAGKHGRGGRHGSGLAVPSCLRWHSSARICATACRRSTPEPGCSRTHPRCAERHSVACAGGR